MASTTAGGEYSPHVEATLSGYLQKKTREGKWQKRWFEVNGIYLTYYKSKKMEKLLAALSLAQVGDICVISAADDAEKMDGLFSIELNTRIYVLRAASDEDAAQWVAVLNKIKAEGGSGRALSRTNSPPPSPSPSQAAAGSGGLHSFHIAAEGGAGAGAEDKVRSPSDGNTDWLKSPRRRWQFCGCCS
eukprot:gene24322-32759_t